MYIVKRSYLSSVLQSSNVGSLGGAEGRAALDGHLGILVRRVGQKSRSVGLSEAERSRSPSGRKGSGSISLGSAGEDLKSLRSSTGLRSRGKRKEVSGGSELARRKVEMNSQRSSLRNKACSSFRCRRERAGSKHSLREENIRDISSYRREIRVKARENSQHSRPYSTPATEKPAFEQKVVQTR